MACSAINGLKFSKDCAISQIEIAVVWPSFHFLDNFYGDESDEDEEVAVYGIECFTPFTAFKQFCAVEQLSQEWVFDVSPSMNFPTFAFKWRRWLLL